MYNDPNLRPNLRTKFEKVHVGDDRQYTEPNTGLWWENTEAEVQEKAPVSHKVLRMMLRIATFVATLRNTTLRFVTCALWLDSAHDGTNVTFCYK